MLSDVNLSFPNMWKTRASPNTEYQHEDGQHGLVGQAVIHAATGLVDDLGKVTLVHLARLLF